MAGGEREGDQVLDEGRFAEQGCMRAAGWPWHWVARALLLSGWAAVTRFLVFFWSWCGQHDQDPQLHGQQFVPPCKGPKTMRLSPCLLALKGQASVTARNLQSDAVSKPGGIGFPFNALEALSFLHRRRQSGELMERLIMHACARAHRGVMEEKDSTLSC